MSTTNAAPDTTPTAEKDTDLAARELDAFKRERDEAVEELKKTKADLAKATKLLKELQNEADKAAKSKMEKDKPSKGGAKKGKKKKDGLGPNDSASLTPSAQFLLSMATPACQHPKIPGLEPHPDSKEFYTKVAEVFPNMRLSTILEAEKKFLAADKNHDGVIDREELDRILIVGVSVFTPGKVEEILKQIDADESGTIDFLEALAVMEKLMSNRKTGLPDQIKQNQSKVCLIQ